MIISNASRSPCMAARYCSRSLASICCDLQPRRLRSRFRAKFLWLRWIGWKARPLLRIRYGSEDDGRKIARRRSQLANAFHLENDHCISHAHEILHARGVPVGEANAPVARSAANCLRIIRAVNTDARLVQAHPQNADEIVRARGEIVIIL